MGMYKFTDGESDMFKGDPPVFTYTSYIKIVDPGFKDGQNFR